MSDSATYLGISRGYWNVFFQTIPQVLTLALMTYTIVFGIVPRFYPQRNWFLLISGVLATMVLAAILESITFQYIHPMVDRWFDEAPQVPTPVVVYASTNILKHGSAVVGFASAILLFKRWWAERERNAELEKKNLHIKLQMLQQQLHPHFLFNTLNNLYGLILDKSERAEEVVVKLSELLSYMLYECKAPFTSLKKELEILKAYILLEQLRFEDRLDISFVINGDPSNKKIAPLLLLPFLDNSFKHGVSENLENPWINLEIQIQEDYLYLHLVNSLTKHAPSKNGGLGLNNAKKRLQLIYGEDHELDISETSDSFCVNLKIPLTQVDPINEDSLQTKKTTASL